MGIPNGPVRARRVIQGPFGMMIWILILAVGYPGVLAVLTVAGSAASVSGKWQATW